MTLLKPPLRLVLLGCIVLIGCTSTSNTASPDVDPENLYPVGSYRQDLETRYGRGAFFWCVNEVPRDEFAAAYIKAMVSLRRPRPVSYEVFARRTLGPGNAVYRDYVFFGEENRVLYATRKSID